MGRSHSQLGVRYGTHHSILRIWVDRGCKTSENGGGYGLRSPVDIPFLYQLEGGDDS